MKNFGYLLLGILIVGTSTYFGNELLLYMNKGDSDKLKESVIQKVYVDYNRKFSVPAGYPQKLIPIIDGSRIAASSVREDPAKNKYYSVTLTVDESVDEVAGWYNSKLKNVKNLRTTNYDGFYSLKFFDRQNYYKVDIYPSLVNGEKKCLVTILISPKTE